MIAIYCDRCGEELTEPGALEISPPGDGGLCVKTHVCVKCWNGLTLVAIGRQVRASERAGRLLTTTLSPDALLDELERDFAKVTKQRDELAGLLGMDTPWPITDVLAKLSDAADHLLRDHACDQHGYEDVAAARDAARAALARIKP